MANPFRNYLTPDKFPGALRNTATVTLGSLLVPYPQYSSLLQRNTDDGRHMRTHTVELRVQRPFSHGVSFFAAYAWTNEQRRSGSTISRSTKCSRAAARTAGSGARPTCPVHRVTAAATWQLPIGRERRFLANLSAPLDTAIGGWQLTPAARYYSGRPLLFNQSLVVDGDPRVSSPTNDRWFDTSKFRGLQDSFTPRNSPWLWDGLVGPSVFLDGHDADQDVLVDVEVPRRGAHRGLQRAQCDRLGQSGSERVEPQLRQGHAEADRRHRPRSANRRAVHLLRDRGSHTPFADGKHRTTKSVRLVQFRDRLASCDGDGQPQIGLREEREHEKAGEHGQPDDPAFETLCRGNHRDRQGVDSVATACTLWMRALTRSSLIGIAARGVPSRGPRNGTGATAG